jgi:glycosyltransferase involved in cell wall biosynthesis
MHSAPAAPAQPFAQLSVVMMAYNELACAPRTVGETCAWLARRVQDWELIFVDDGSTDGCADAVEALTSGNPRVRVLRHDRNRGMGAAIRTGYGAATKEWVTQLPADGQVPPETFELFFARLPGPDLVLSVYDKRGDGLLRTILSGGYATLGRLLLGKRSDYTGTMLLRRALLKDLPIRSDTFLANLEVPLRLLERGATFQVVTFRPSPRIAGQSKVLGLRRIARVAAEMLRLRRNWNKPL